MKKRNIILFALSLVATLFFFSFAKAETFEFTNPVGFGSIDEGLVAVLAALMRIVAVIAIIFIVIGGIMYMLSAGDEGMIKKAKSTVTSAVVGLALTIAAPTFLKEVKNILDSGVSSDSVEGLVDSAPSLLDIANNVLGFLLSIVGMLGIIGIIIGGIMYLTSYGNEKQVEKGETILKYSILGTVISFGALVLIRQIASLLGVGV